MIESQSCSYSLEVTELLHRLVTLRRRFRVGLPENLAALRLRLDKSNLGDKVEGLGDFDLFYFVGIILFGQPDPISMGELSHALGVPLSTATRIVDWLVKNDYAERLPDGEDRRIVRVGLTDAGREMVHTINAFFLERIERFLRQFTIDERQNMLLLLTKLFAALDAGE
jgi:DNA-binding MarR family transcriptional regulator